MLSAGLVDGRGALTAALQSTGSVSLEEMHRLVFGPRIWAVGPLSSRQASLLGSWPSSLKSFHSGFFRLGISLLSLQ